MTVRLSVDDVVEINRVLCGDTGEGFALLDPGSLEGAVERPYSGFGETALFPSLYDKAAALLHGIASRQVFENGNKRTAWSAAVVFLDLNGIDIGPVRRVQADMFVRAAALDHSLSISDLAEWFQATEQECRDRQSMTFTAYDGKRMKTPAGVLAAGLPTSDSVPLGEAMLFRVADAHTMEVFVLSTTIVPENIDRDREDRDTSVLAAFRMPTRELQGYCRSFVEHIAPDVLREPPAMSPAGRNNPCPCGSGMKFKRCHGRPAGAQ